MLVGLNPGVEQVGGDGGQGCRGRGSSGGTTESAEGGCMEWERELRARSGWGRRDFTVGSNSSGEEGGVPEKSLSWLLP